MDNKYVPLNKQSKRKRREYYAARCQGWEGLNPVTRKTPIKKHISTKSRAMALE